MRLGPPTGKKGSGRWDHGPILVDVAFGGRLREME